MRAYEFESQDLPSVERARQAIPQILARAQRDYDAWDETDRDTYAGGGICHIIADSVCDVLSDAGIECTSVSCSHEQHVYVAARFSEGVYTIDIPYHIYEQGGGFSWKKLPDVRFEPRDVVFYRVSGDPADWRDYLDEGMRDVVNFVRNIGSERDAPIVMMTNPQNTGARTASGQRMRIEDFPLKTVAVSELRPWEPMIKMRDLPSQRTVASLTRTLQQGGRIPPLLVTPVRGGYRIIDGHHRYAALQRAGIDRAPVRVVDPRLIRYSDEVMEALKITLERYGHLGAPGVAEGSENLSYIGNCTDDDVIEHIFGDATNFAQAVEDHGDEFTIGDLVVKYDPESDVHSFYYKKQGVTEGIDPNTFEDLDARIIARAAKQIVPTARARRTPEGYVHVTTEDGLNLYIGAGVADGSISVNIGSGGGVTTSGAHKGAVTDIIRGVYLAAVRKYGEPDTPGELTIDHDAGHGVWQHIADKLGLRYAAVEVKESDVRRGQLGETRDQLWSWIQAKFPSPQWPEYVQRDFLYAKAKGIHNQKDLKDFLDEIQRDFGRVKWRLQKLPITLNIFTPKTQGMIRQREGGSKNPYQVPKDAERHALQQQMIQQKGVSPEPIIVAKLSNGYDLIEGWHRTIQHLKAYPQGYTGPAWVGYGATYTSESKQGVAEGRISDLDIDLQDQQWEAVVGRVEHGVRRGEDPDRMSLALYQWATREMFDVDEELERRGFGSVADLRDHIRDHGGRYVPPEFDLGSAGSIKDIERRPRQRPDDVAENFADGKVKGKSRPGRVRRAGASCKGSVTDLRARARKYGGERGKMYHWCANMKSGAKNS